MVRKKNLSKIDLEDVSIWEEKNNFDNNSKKIQINDIPIKIKCLNEKQKELKKLIETNEIIISIGPAGTGKTYLSLITALHLLKTEPRYRKIVLIKSIQQIQGENIGILPGNLTEKLLPFMESYMINLKKILKKEELRSLMDQEIITILPISYLRGCDFSNSIIIIDETQNITMNSFKTIITRIGQNSKMIFLGDIEQCDLPKNEIENSCLARIFKMFIDQPNIGLIEFTEKECVRNPIIPIILNLLRMEKME